MTGLCHSSLPPATPTLRLALPAGATQVTFYYRDRAEGQATLTASAEGLTATTQSATITARDATSLNLGCGCGATAPGEAFATLGLALGVASRRLRRARRNATRLDGF